MVGVRCSCIAILATLLCLSGLPEANGQIEGLQRGRCSPNNPCLNGGTCYQPFSIIYFCDCTADYIGLNCEDEHPCVSNPCENGGTCEATEDGEGRTCTCPGNVAGVDCETVLPCFDQPCLNGGTCSNIENGEDFECACPDGYEGETCESEVGMEPECGINPAAPASPRYFGGSDAPLGKWPWQGYIKFSRGINYGATLIAPQWAVTSGGNIDILSTPSAIDVVIFGDTYQGEDEERQSDYKQFAYVEKIVRYPGMNLRLADGDAMLLKFTEPLEINDYVRPICLPSADVNEGEDYDMCYTTGWGVDENFEPNSYLKEGRATVIDLETCSNIFLEIDGQILPNENMICSQQVNPSDGPCVGDGGNALVCSRDGIWDLVGTISWGYECGGELPFVNWRTSAFLDSINYIVFDGPEPDFCEPIELEECTSYLPYAETYMNQQEQVLHVINNFLEIGAGSAYCDLEELQELLCAVNLGQCNNGDEGQKVICKAYCEGVRDLCNLTDTTMCVDLPYGADYYQQWCTRGKDYSCGNQTIYLEPDSPTTLSSPLYPKEYPQLRNCRWDIYAPEGYFIYIKYSHLNIYPDGDFLTYGEGDPKLLTSIVDRFDGGMAPPIFKSSGNEMWIGFQSNHRDGDIGFHFYLSAIPEEGGECEEDDFICDGTCYTHYVRCDFVTDCKDGTDEMGCNNVLVAEESTLIFSPFYPIPGYPPNFDYTWNLEVPEGYLVGLNFYDLNLDYGGEDYVLVGEGRDGEIEDALYHLNGTKYALRILPFARSVWIRLLSDEVRYGGRGFIVNATYELEEGECYEGYEFDCGDGTCLPSYVACNGKVECPSGADEENCTAYCADGTEIPLEERCNRMFFCYAGEDEKGCELAKVGDTWYFEVPRNKSSPYEYISDALLAWIVRAEEGLGFEVKFDEFSIELDYDVLYIGSTPEDHEALQHFTGRLTPDPFFIEEETFFAVFTSDSNKNFGGVTLKVRVVELDDVFTCEKGNRIHSKLLCDGLWHCPDGSDEVDCDPLPRYGNGSVVTPRFPLPYENNADVTWNFVAEEGLRLAFFPYIFYTEEGYDILRIGSGTDCEESYSTELSGYAGPDEPVLSEDNTLCLHFSSDETITAYGIYGHVVAVSEEDFIECPENGEVVIGEYVCDGIWQCLETGVDEIDCPPLPEGLTPISSPGYPLPYPPNFTEITSGSWPEGTRIIFEFTVFDLEDGVDFLIIGCGDDPSDASSVIANLTGSENPGLIIGDCLRGWTKFVSDGKGSNLGYKGFISIVNSSSPCICTLRYDPVCGADGVTYGNLCQLQCVDPEMAYTPGECEAPCICTLQYDPVCGADGVTYGNLCGLQCVDPEMSYTPGACEETECQRQVRELDEMAGPIVGGFRPTCADDGRFTPRQCHGSTGFCWCVDLEAGIEIPDTRTGPGENRVECVPVDPCRRPPPMSGTPEEICSFVMTCHPGEPTCTPIQAEMPQPVYSPGFPELYPNNLAEVDVFVAPVGYLPVVNITNFAVEYKFDTLAIRSPSGDLVTLTGNDLELPIVVRSPRRIVELNFTTDESGVDEGYSGYVYVVPEEVDPCRAHPEGGSPEEICSFVMTCLGRNGTVPTCTVISNASQPVYSPNYPSLYNDSLRLIDVFVAPTGYRPVVNITDFATEFGFDTLTILANQRPLGRLTGNEVDLPFIVASPSSLVVLHFESDGAIADRGYFGHVYAVSEEELVICEDGSVPPEEALCNYLWDCSEGADEEDCEPLEVGSTTILTSPGYPDDYPNDQYIVWTLQGEPLSLFVLNVTYLETEYNFDFLKVGYGDDPTDSGTILASLSGEERPEELILVPSNQLWVSFTSDSSFNLGGFELNISLVEDIRFNCSDGSVVGSSQVCDYVLDCYDGEDESSCDVLEEGDYAIICNPISGDYYEEDTNITYVVRAEEGLVLLVNFTSFRTELIFDRVTIGNGDDPSDPDSKIAKASGFEIPPDIITDESTLWMRFTSDSNLNHAGFCANISAVDIEDFATCDNGDVIPPSENCNYVWYCEEGTDENGSYESPCAALGLASYRNFSSPYYPYPVDMNCTRTWSYVAEPGLIFNISVREFDRPDGSLTIGYGVDPANESTVLLVITNDTPPEELVVLTPERKIWAQFKCGREGSGFFADLYTVLPGQDDEICGSFPCYNGGNCTNYSDYDPEYYYCECPHFFTGRNCETHFCDGNGECYNGGTCVGEGDSYCICPDGYTGDFCEFEYEFVNGTICGSYLPYNESKTFSVFEYNFPLERDVLTMLLFAATCDDERVLRAVCWSIYPPAYPLEFPYSPCYGTCLDFFAESNGGCSNIGLLLSVDCEVFMDYTEMSDYPGLCHGTTPWYR